MRAFGKKDLVLFEYMLLPLLNDNFKLRDQQLGYRNQSSCTYTVIIMKEIVMQYNKEDNNIHCAIIDISKAVDEINHDVMIDKILKSSLPKIMYKILDICRKIYALMFALIMKNEKNG